MTKRRENTMTKETMMIIGDGIEQDEIRLSKTWQNGRFVDVSRGYVPWIWRMKKKVKVKGEYRKV